MFNVERILSDGGLSVNKRRCFFCDNGFSETLHQHVDEDDLVEVHREKKSLFGNTFKIEKKLDATHNLVLVVNTKNVDPKHLHFETSTTGKRIKHALKPDSVNIIEVQKLIPKPSNKMDSNRDFHISVLLNLDKSEVNLHGNASYPRTISVPQELAVKAFWKNVSRK